MTSLVCKEPDPYFGQYSDSNAYWLVTLSNKETIYQDDGRPGLEIESAWIRLKQYCLENELYIVDMRVNFRSNSHLVGEFAEGFYFCKGVSGTLYSANSNNLYITGTLKGSVVEVTKWKVPELLSEGSEYRNPAFAGDCLISKP